MESNNYNLILRILISWMVRYSDDIEIRQNNNRITLRVNRADHGMIIGASGRNVKRIKNIMRYMAQRNGSEIELDVLEPKVGVHERFPTQSSSEWNKDDQLLSFVETLISNLVGSQVHASMVRDGGTTAITVPVQMNIEIEADVSALFHAIGKANGHAITISFVDAAQSCNGPR